MIDNSERDKEIGIYDKRINQRTSSKQDITYYLKNKKLLINNIFTRSGWLFIIALALLLPFILAQYVPQTSINREVNNERI